MSAKTSSEIVEMLRIKDARLKSYLKLTNHVLAALAALFELITGEKPPKRKELLAMDMGKRTFSKED